MERAPPVPLLLLSAVALALFFPPSSSKSTIEPCSGSDSCQAMVGYTLYTDLKVSEVAGLFQIDPVALLIANSLDISHPDLEHHILPSGLFLKVPVNCSCSNGIRRSVSTRYRARPMDTLSVIADTIYAGLVSADQIREANGISDPSAVVDTGEMLVIPLPCTCFGNIDNNLPAVYLSYLVGVGETVAGIAAKYFTTVTDIMNANAMGVPAVKPGDVLAVPLPACASKFPKYASDHGLIVPNGSYTIAASHCVQCSCGPGDMSLHCTPASMAVSCSSMQCKGSNLMLGNFSVKQSTAGCKVTSCTYGGFVNETIVTLLSTSLQPRCPGQHQFPALLPLPSSNVHGSAFAPSLCPSPFSAGGGSRFPRSVPSSSALPVGGLSPSSGPMESSSKSHPSINPRPTFFGITTLYMLKLVLYLQSS